MAVSVARLFAVALSVGSSLWGRNPSDLIIPAWCGTAGAVTVYEASFHPSDKAAREYNQGTADQLAGNSDSAIRHYRKALESDPKFTAAQNNLGQLLLEAREAAAAVPILEEAVQTDPACASLYTNLAMAYILTGRPADGDAAARRSRSLDSADPHNRLISAAALFIQDRPTVDAVRIIQTATPEHQLSILRLAADLVALGERQDARNLLMRYIEIEGTPRDIRERAQAGLRILGQ